MPGAFICAYFIALKVVRRLCIFTGTIAVFAEILVFVRIGVGVGVGPSPLLSPSSTERSSRLSWSPYAVEIRGGPSLNSKTKIKGGETFSSDDGTISASLTL